jgi:NaMN:DMB phosphoribosyltransferase
MQVMTPSRSLDDTVDVIRNYGDRVLLCFFGIAGQAAIR